MKNNNLKLKDEVVEEKRHWVRITSACNNNCLFCLDSENHNGKIIPFKEVVKDLKAGIESGCVRAIISGGEPSIHSDIFKIIKYAKKIGYSHVQMISNGRMFAYEEFTRSAKTAGLDEITFSLHSHLKEQLEEMTRVKGSYLQAMKGLSNALKYSFIISIDIVISKINYKNLRETMLFFIALGVTEFDLLYLIPSGSAWENRGRLFIEPAKVGKYLKEALALSSNHDLFIWTNRLPAELLEGYEQFIQNPVKLQSELHGMRSQFESYIKNGNLMSCYGERCQYCFMRGFCTDLITLKKTGQLESKPTPLCLPKIKKKNKLFKFDERLDIHKFLDFYIKHRYFIKSVKCRKCKYDKNCSGARINKIRESGFKILKLLELKQ